MKKNKLPTRKQLALRRLALALITLLAVNHVFQCFFLLPMQAVRHSEEAYGVHSTAVVKRRWLSEMQNSRLLYLCAGEETLSLWGVNFEFPMGWVSWEGGVVDCSDEKPLHASWTYMANRRPHSTYMRDWERQYHLFFCGRLDDWDICKLDIRISYEVSGEDGTFEPRQSTWTVTDFPEKGGRRYFLAETVPEDLPMVSHYIQNIILTAYDRSGNIVAEQDLTDARL